MKRTRLLIFPGLLVLIFLLGACRQTTESDITYDAANLQFSGEQAFALEEEFVNQFPDRASGMPNVALSTKWLQEQFESYGLSCTTDEWEVTNFSETVPMKNVMCQLSGASEREIIVMAHHDQSPQTVYGADNDGSGIAIILHLAQLFAAEAPGPYTLVFLADDGEEYGMLGSLRYIEQHPDPQRIIAAVSLDNVGKHFYDGIEMKSIGQFDGFGPPWLLQAARDAAQVAVDAGDSTITVPVIRDPFTQVIDQAVPISLMDQGPLVAAGVPAFGFAGLVPPEFEDLHDQSYHTPGDTMELQSPVILQETGRATEALIRHLQTMQTFPKEPAPYLYFAIDNNILAGPILWLIFAVFVALFFIASLWFGRKLPHGRSVGLRSALPHFLGLWLPFVLSVISLYVMTALGLLQKFEQYFALARSPSYTDPRWPAVILFLLGMAVFLYFGRKLTGLLQTTRPDFQSTKSLALFIIGLATLYIAIVNPFSLLLTIPLLFWLLISGRRGTAFALDILFFILGGTLLYYMMYTFGFVLLGINWYILWYIMMMMAVPMVGFATMTVICAIVAAGLSMIVRPPALTQEEKAAPVEAVAES